MYTYLIETMATKSSHLCSKCGYECHSYSGRGFFGQKISMVVCLGCNTVQPLTVGGMIAEIAPSFSSEYGRLCPECMSKDLRLWDGHTCPKCGNEMAKKGTDEFWT